MKPRTRVFKVVTLLVLGIMCFAIFFVFSHAVPFARFNQVEVGMTESRVQEILGTPQVIRHDTADSTAFFYGGFLRLRWCTMEVFFGSDGRVTGKFHDH